MYTAIAILIVIASIFLTIVVLVQNSKGGGLAANFAAGNQAFGVRQAAEPQFPVDPLQSTQQQTTEAQNTGN